MPEITHHKLARFPRAGDRATLSNGLSLTVLLVTDALVVWVREPPARRVGGFADWATRAEWRRLVHEQARREKALGLTVRSYRDDLDSPAGGKET